MADFAETWRKRKACNRCRKLKTKCFFASPEDDKCQRCIKSDSVCETNLPRNEAGLLPVMPTPRQSSVQSYDYAGFPHIETNQIVVADSATAWLEEIKARPTANQTEKENKIIQLQDLIERANEELYGLQGMLYARNVYPPERGYEVAQMPPPSMDYMQIDSPYDMAVVGSHGLQLPQVIQDAFVDADWSVNWVKVAIEGGLVTEQTAQSLYSTFLSTYTPALFFQMEHLSSLTSFAENHSLLALSYITAAHCASPNRDFETSALLVRLVDRAIAEYCSSADSDDTPTSPGEANFGLDAIRAIIVGTQFFYPRSRDKDVQNLHLAVMLTNYLDLASVDEVKALVDRKNTPPDEFRYCQERIQTYFAVYIAASWQAITRCKVRLYKSLPPVTHTLHLLDRYNESEFDQILYDLTHLLSTAFTMMTDLGSGIDEALPHRKMRKKLGRLVDEYNSLASECGLSPSHRARSDDKERLANTNYHMVQLIEVVHQHMLASMSEMLLFNVAYSLHKLNETDADFANVLDDDTLRNDFETLSRDITTHIDKVLASFGRICSGNVVITKYSYMLPLASVETLIRLRLTHWSLGQDFDLDLDSIYSQFKETWSSASQRTFQLEHDRISRIDKLMRLRMQGLPPSPSANGGGNNGVESKATRRRSRAPSAHTLLHKILRGIVVDTEIMNANQRWLYSDHDRLPSMSRKQLINKSPIKQIDIMSVLSSDGGFDIQNDEANLGQITQDIESLLKNLFTRSGV
ncbi:hypothetical protein TRVA0_007S03840 [Trichomonascus vanleenenianus]|uniref:Zn(II)2Cys6 transcription factor domain-containing protein n=1 Tax=Trichomonascus vanleenenianus TaxID=2268995 RepID=UPI003ECA09A8